MEQTPERASPAGDHSPARPSPAAGPALLVRLRGGLWPDAFAIAMLALAALLFFWPVVSGRAWLPKGGGDSVAYLFPMYRFAADSLRAGDSRP